MESIGRVPLWRQNEP